jgi:threonine synthase
MKGNFDDAMRVVQEVSEKLGLYLLNSVNPWRIEGQKAILFELLQQRDWEPPDWVVLPAGNLGNTSAIGKAIREAYSLKLIERIPRVASIQAEGSNPFYQLWKGGSDSLDPIKPDTVASAIKIGNPVSWRKALKVIKETRGVVSQVNDKEIMDAKAIVDNCGIGCEPASAASVAGAAKLVNEGVIDRGEDVVCILTGNLLKDPEVTVRYHLGELPGITPSQGNRLKVLEADVDSIMNALGVAQMGESQS